MASTSTPTAGRRDRGGPLRLIGSGVAMLAAASLVAACGSAGQAGNSGPGGAMAAGQRARGPGTAVVSARTLPGIGTVLVDRAGKTLYSPRQEAHGTIVCTGPCLSFWFPAAVRASAQLRAASSIAGALGTVRRPDDGLTQLTYHGRPLYTFRLDQAPGQAHGNDFTDHFGGRSFVWQAVTTGKAPAPGGMPASGGYSNQGGSSGY